MFYFTVLISVMFSILIISQSTNNSIKRMITRGRIHAGNLSYNDIVRLTAKMYTTRQFTAYDSLSGRVYKARNGRLYHVRMVNGHKSIKFVSLQTAINHVQYTIDGAAVIGQFHSHYISWNIPAPAAI